LYTVGRLEGVSAKEVETEERKQEDVMKRFRSRNRNILVATSVLEEGIDMPACHVVVRYDLPQSYRAYVYSKARARARKAHYLLMVKDSEVADFLTDLSQFHATEQMLLRKCGYHNLISECEYSTEVLNLIQKPYHPSGSHGPSVSLQNSIAIINKYAFILILKSIVKTCFVSFC
jgi:endoribonuclease Dicer